MSRAAQIGLVRGLALAAEWAWIWAAMALASAWNAPNPFPAWQVWLFHPAMVTLSLALRRQRVGRSAKLAERWAVVTLMLGWLAWQEVSLSLQPYAAFYALAGAGAFGWMGWVFMERPMTFDGQLTRFQAGAIMMVAITALAPLTHVTIDSGTPLIAAFFLTSFGALTLTRSGLVGSSGNTWVVPTLGVTLTVGIAGLLMLAVFNQSTLHGAWDGILSIYHGVDRLVGGRLPDFAQPANVPPDPTTFATPVAETPPKVPPISPWVVKTVVVIAAVGGIALLGASIAFILNQIRKWFLAQRSMDVETEHIGVGMRLDWRGWLAALLAALLRRPRALFRRLTMRPENDATNQYRLLLRWGRAQGLPRLASQTPLEYLDALSQTWPGLHGDFSNITQPYIATRYASIAPGGAAMREATVSWRTLRKVRGGWATRMGRRLQPRFLKRTSVEH